MRLGSDTGSLVNHIYSRSTLGQPAPFVGMGCTLLGWTDRQAGTIVKVEELEAKDYQFVVHVTEDTATVVKGSCQDGSAVYEFKSNPDGHRTQFRSRRDNGKWERVALSSKGRWTKVDGYGLRIGARDHYHDPHF